MTRDEKRTFSLEYFPPRSEAGEQSLAAARQGIKQARTRLLPQ